MKKKLFTAAKLAITLLLFYFIFRKIDFSQFGATLRNARLDILIGSFLILWIAHLLCIYRWRMLMRPLMPVLSMPNLIAIYLIGLFFNLTFPTVVGGDVIKMYYAGKPSRNYAQSFAAAFLDRDAGMLAMMIIACIAVLIHPGPRVVVLGIPVSIIVWGFFILFAVGNVAIFAPGFHRLLTALLHRLKMSRIAVKIDMISNAFQIMGKHKSVLLISLVISLANQLFSIVVTWIIALGLHINNVPLYYFLIFVPVITLISMIPISLSGMGLREAYFMILFRSVGVPDATGYALGVISSIIIILSAIPGGIIYLFYRNRVDLQQLAALENEFS
jgi:glycosyltransferase 2 family protein